MSRLTNPRLNLVDGSEWRSPPRAGAFGAGGRGRRTRVIAADDAPIFLELLALTLSSVPEIDLIATAENGRDAVDLVVTHDVDVALLDIEMPILDGFGAALEILQLRPKTKVLLHTATQSDVHRKRAEQLNVELHDKLELASTIELIRQPLPSIWPPTAA